MGCLKLGSVLPYLSNPGQLSAMSVQYCPVLCRCYMQLSRAVTSVTTVTVWNENRGLLMYSSEVHTRGSQVYMYYLCKGKLQICPVREEQGEEMYVKIKSRA